MAELLAPNGKPSNLTPEQYKLVRKPEFKAWFGDWENDPENASKVIDENGEPLVVYHGTNNEFNVFDFNKADIGFHFGTFTQAKNRLETKLFFKGSKSNISMFFLNIKSIYQVSDIGDWEYPQRYLDMFMSDNIISESEFKKNGFQFLNYKEDNKKIRDFLIKKYNNTIGFEYNNKYEDKGKSYIVIHSNQIKLADGSNTTFDVNNPDIRFEEGGSVIINPTEIECHKCHWKWKVQDGGDDLFICHKCYTDNTKYYKFEGLTAEKMLENPLTIKYLKDLDDGEGWWVDKFHAKTKNYKLNTYYHLKTEGLNAGVGKGLYLGKDKNALISFYGIELENIELDTYIGNPKWLDLMEYSDFENVKKEALSKYKLSKDLTGIKLLDAIGERIKKLALEKGYDGIRYYDPNATGEEFVLFNTNKLKKNINVKHSNYKLNNGGLVGNIYTETIYFAISYTENTYDIYAQGNDLDKIRSEYNSISPSDFDNPNSDYNSKLLESRINQYEFIGDNTLNAEDYVDDLQNTDYWNLTEEDINTIEFDSVFAINKSTDEMIDEIREFIKQEHNIGGRYAEKYMTISVNDEDGEFIADLKIRTADHSQNARNNDNTSYNLSFVIANKNATEGRFIPLGTQYYYDDSADIEDIKEEIKGIIDEKIEYIKEKGKKYEDGGDIQAYEDAMGISEFKEGGETTPKKVYVSIRLEYERKKIPNTFYEYFYTYSEKPFEELKNGTLEGLVGVSSSPNNIAEWFVKRDCLIVMDYDRFMSMNETEAINYYDPYQLMKNNLYLFRRLYANVSRYGEQDDAVISTLKKILEKIVPEINLEINVSKGQKYTELYRISRFLNTYITSAFPNWIEKNQIKIENPIDLTNAILDFNKLNDSYLGSGFENPVLTFDELLPIVEKGITNASSIYDSEQEIVLINRQLNIPKNSQLFFIDKDEVGRERESNRNELIEKYNLREIYKVYFVDRQDVKKYRLIWEKKNTEKEEIQYAKRVADLELKKEQVVQELLDYFLEKSISYVKNELEKEIIEYNESLDFYDETDDNYVEQNLFSIPLVVSLMNTYILIVKNCWKSFIQKKLVKDLDRYAFDIFYFNVKQELKNYFENNKDELEKLNNYRNARGSGSLYTYRFERLLLKTIDDYENLPELIGYKELAKMYLDKMGREIYRYYDKNDLKLIPTQYKKGGESDEPNEFWGTEAGGVLVYCSTTERYLILLRSEWVLEPNTWGIISGKLDDKENVQEAVLREAEEETGYKLGHLIPSFVFEKPNFKFHNFVSIVNEEFTPELNWENSDYKWVKLDEMPDNLHFGLKLLIEKEDLQKLIITNKNYSMNKYNPKDIPLLIRFSELIIEEVKSNAQLHKIIENMLKTKDNGVLSMKDYYSIIGDEITSEQEEPKMKEGGKVDYIKSNKGDIKISLAENWYSDDTDVELVPVSELIKFREFDRKEKPKYNKDNSVDNINHLKFMFQKEGVKEPLIIEYSKEDNAVLIIEGNHRINSAIDLGMEYLPARVVLKKYSKFSPSQSKNSLKVEGIKINSSNYIPSNLKPSQVGIAGTMPIYADGGIIEGRLHSECDVNEGCGRKFQVGENGHIIEAERDEAVIVASAFESNEELTIKGTPSEVASALNVLGGGKNFDKGATIIKNGQELEIPELKKQAQETDVDDIIEPSSIIINRRSMADEKEYEVTGTPKQIASAINSINGNGVVIEKGAEIKEN